METKLEKRILSNGMPVYFYFDPNKYSAEVQLVTKVGGRSKDFVFEEDEYHVSDGMAHFLEHLLLEHSQFGNMIKVFGEHQMSCNGVTTPNMTNYYFKTVKYLDFGIETLLKGINQAIFTKEDIEATKPAIYEEIRMSRDNKSRLLFEERNKNLYYKTRYINSIGTLKDIENITYEDIKKYYDAFYYPENQMLFIGGFFEIEHLYELLEKIVKTLPKSEKKGKLLCYDEPDEVKIKESEVTMATGESIANVTYKINISDFNKKEQITLSYYLSYFRRMNFGVTSKVYHELIKKGIIQDNINVAMMTNSSFLEFTIGSYTKEPQKFLSAILEVVKNPTFDKELFELYKNRDKMDLCCQAENYSVMLDQLLDNILFFDKEDFDTIELIDNFDFDDFKKMIKRLNFNHYTIITLNDEEGI